MKSLARLLISHVFISIFVTFFLLSGHIERFLIDFFKELIESIEVNQTKNDTDY